MIALITDNIAEQVLVNTGIYSVENAKYNCYIRKIYNIFTTAMISGNIVINDCYHNCNSLCWEFLQNRKAIVSLRKIPTYISCIVLLVYRFRLLTNRSTFQRPLQLLKSFPLSFLLSFPSKSIIYINDLPACSSSNELEFLLFADDTSIFLEQKDLDVLTSHLNGQLHNVSTWLKAQ